jgi:uncharacterized repeat protein (TIGR03847 family)
MPRFELDLNPLQHITVDAIGQPGQRVFYIQGWRETDPLPVTIIIEKVQLQSLMQGVDQLLSELSRQKPDLITPAVEIDPDKMRITPPVDPLFRAGELGLGFDADHNLIIIMAREVIMEDGDPAKAAEVRFWCTLAQVRRLADWGKQVINRGRPLCPQCGQPMEPEGHFCPKKNGHKH